MDDPAWRFRLSFCICELALGTEEEQPFSPSYLPVCFFVSKDTLLSDYSHRFDAHIVPVGLVPISL